MMMRSLNTLSCASIRLATLDVKLTFATQENATSTVQWTIHKPVKGWYIRLRSPSFSPGSFISLTPPPTSSPFHSEAALTFSCRTNVPTPPRTSTATSGSRRSRDSDVTLTCESTVHSYPPTPPPQNPAIRVSPPSPRSVHAKLAEIPQARPAQQVMPFVLAPHSHAHVPHQQKQQLSVFARVVSALKNSAPSHSSSFTLSPVPPPSSPQIAAGVVPTPTPLLTYHDRTPVWKVGSTYGLLEIDAERERELGVQTSFYVAVALTYLEFLTDREVSAVLDTLTLHTEQMPQSYLAAVTD